MRYHTYEKEGVPVRVRISVSLEQISMNPDPDHTHEFMLTHGWLCVHTDPIPGIVMSKLHLYPSQLGYPYRVF